MNNIANGLVMHMMSGLANTTTNGLMRIMTNGLIIVTMSGLIIVTMSGASFELSVLSSLESNLALRASRSVSSVSVNLAKAISLELVI
jgi:hypothetical protein